MAGIDGEPPPDVGDGTGSIPTVWVIDGNNVMGSGGDGWWKHRDRSMRALANEIAVWCRSHDDQVALVFDGVDQPTIGEIAGGNLSIRFAGSSRRDAADHVVVALAISAKEEQLDHQIIVATSDRGLIKRLPPDVLIEGGGTFLHRVRPRR